MGSPIHELGFASLVHHAGGDTNAQFNRALSQVSLDCMERPGESKARSVTLKMIFEPVVDQDGFVVDVAMHAEVGVSLPGYKSKKSSVAMRRRGNQGTFVFSDDGDSNSNQGSLGLGGDDDE